MWSQVLLGVAAGLLLLWLAGVAALYLIGRKQDDPGTPRT